jgi:hypothetical protein
LHLAQDADSFRGCMVPTDLDLSVWGQRREPAKHFPVASLLQPIIAYYKWKADRVIGEVNQGGDMVENVLRTVDANVAYKAVHASRGKVRPGRARSGPVRTTSGLSRRYVFDARRSALFVHAGYAAQRRFARSG